MMNANTKLEALLSANEAVFNWCVRSAGQAQQAGRFEAAAEWCSLAGYSAAFTGWFGALASPALEALLLKLGAEIPVFPKLPVAPQKKRWLHVMTTAYEIGGHTNLVCRWLQNDRDQACHNVILMDQDVAFPEKLRVAAEATGGAIHLMERGLGHLERALKLRKYAATHADIVVLHLHPQDVASVMAFAVPGEIPVCLMNHMDHLFWTGTGMTDVLIEFREIGKSWSQKYRGMDRSVIVPLPLEAPKLGGPENGKSSRREAIRRKMGIPADAVVLLSVATPYKFRPAGEWDFRRTLQIILDQCSEAVVLMVGPGPADLDRMWGQDAWRSSGRIMAVGGQSDMADFYAVADVALGSFPFASQTAVLECALHGLPCVPTPAAIRFGFDDVAFQTAPSPVNQADFATEAIRLVQNSKLRESEGRTLAASVVRHHCGSGWMDCLAQLRAALPAVHRVYPSSPCQRLERDACEFWAGFSKLGEIPALRQIHGRIIANGSKVTPRHDAELMRDLKNSQPQERFPGVSFLLRDVRFKLGRLKRDLLSQN
jgi:hypothetical protein